MEKMEKLNNRILTIVPYISALALVVYIVCVFISPNGNALSLKYNIMFALPIAIVNFIIVKAYLNHNKNLQKALLGFILSGLVMLSMHYTFSVKISTWYFIVLIAMFALIVIFTINQFLLSNDHYCRPGMVFVNQAIMNILVITSLVSTVVDVVQFHDNPLIFISLLIFIIASMYLTLIIEMRVNDLKIAREEKGYVFVKTANNEEELTKEDMFISNKIFNTLPWIIVVSLACSIIFNAIFDKAITRGYSLRYLFDVVEIICLFVAIMTYKHHNKDVMKNMNGFLLGLLLFEDIYEITFISWDNITVKAITVLVMIAFNAFFLITHLILTKTHASNTKVVKLMKAMYIVYAIALIATAISWQVYYLMAKGTNYYFFLIKPFIWLLGTFPITTAILTIDSRVNGFKVRREEK